MLSDSQKDIDLAYSRIKGLTPEAKAARTGEKPPPANSGEGVTSNFEAPKATHVAALRANPSQTAAFDAKFGPGAAAEYLGK